MAEDFCRRVAQPVAGSPVTEYRPSSDRLWHPSWLVRFPGEAEVEVAEPSGHISLFWDETRSRSSNGGHRGDHFFPRRAGPAIPEAEAVERASAALRETGFAQDLTQEAQAREVQTHGDGLYHTHSWEVRWRRQFRGVPYREGVGSVWLQAETGALHAISVVLPVPPPYGLLVAVGLEEARGVAEAQLMMAVDVGSVCREAELEIVVPNEFWRNGEVTPVSGAVANAAWNFLFAFGKGESQYEVWVDALTGEVIGGYAYILPHPLP